MYIRTSVAVVLAVLVAACTSNKPVGDPGKPAGNSPAKPVAGRYSMQHDQGPDTDIDVNVIPDAVPKIEPRTIAGNMSPYSVLGKTYSVQFNTRGFSQTGYASWYGKKFHGERTSNGEIYNMFAMTAAHKTLPIPCYVRVTNLDNNKAVILRVNDRGPFHDDRIVDLTYTAAKKLGFHHMGTARVRLDVVNTGEIQTAPIAAFKPAPAGKIAPVDARFPSSKIDSIKASGTPAGTRPIVSSAPKVKAGSPDVIPPTYLQVGSFSTQMAAQNLQKTLQGSTHYPIVLIPVEGKNLFRVLIGPFAQNSEIQVLKQQLIAKKLSNPYIVQGIKKH